MKPHLLSLLALSGLALSANAAQPEQLLQRMADYAKEQGINVYDICLIKDGVSHLKRLAPSSNCHNSYSVTKAFTATAIGILQDRGQLTVDDPIFPLFKNLFPADADPQWQKVTIRHLLTHRTGFAPKDNIDIDCCNMAQLPSEDHLRLAFATKLTYAPGSKSVYTDTSFYILSRVVTAVSGQKLDDFLRDEIFRPLKFREYAMSKCPLGYPIGATGLYIATDDMAKLGQLYLQNGVYDGKRIISEAFVKQALGTFELHSFHHGFAKGGMCGQFLYLNPSLNLAIAIHSFTNKSPNTIITHVLSAEELKK